MTDPRMMEYQLKEIISQLSLTQLHDEDKNCPCTFSGGDLQEFCLPKHFLTISALSTESASMTDDKNLAKLLFDIAEESADYHQKAKKGIICKRGDFPQAIAKWAREARKKLERFYYACKVNLRQQPLAELEQKIAYLYHGTTDKFLDEIKEKGLCPPRLAHVVGTPYESEHLNTVYFARTPEAAFVLADQVVYSHGGNQIVLRVKRKDLAEIAESIVDRKGEVAVRLKRCIPYGLLIVIRDRPRGYFEQSKPVTISGKCTDAKGCSFRVVKTATTGAKACSVDELVKSVDAVTRTSCTCKPEKVTPCGAAAKGATCDSGYFRARQELTKEEKERLKEVARKAAGEDLTMEDIEVGADPATVDG